MAVETTLNRKVYTGNGVTTAFPTTFQFLDAEDLVVIERVTATGVETTKTLTTDYAVSGGSGETGTVTMITAPASGTTLTIYNDPAITQSLDLIEGDVSPAEAKERAWDRLTYISQRLADRVDRALRLPETEDLSVVLPSSVERASQFLAFDADGNIIAATPSADGVPASAFMQTVLDDADASSALTTLGFSTYIKTLIDDTTAAAARTTLGFGASGAFIVFGDIGAGAVTGSKSKSTITASKIITYAQTAEDDIIPVDSSAGAFTVTLLAVASSSGKIVRIHKTSSDFNAVTITDGGATLTTSVNTQDEVVVVYCNGTTWKILDRRIPSEWIACTVTCGLTGGTTAVSAFQRRIGDTLQVWIDALFSTVFTGGAASFSVPNSLVIDTAKIPGTVSGGVVPIVGTVRHLDIGSENYAGDVYYSSTTAVLARVWLDDAGAGSNHVGCADSISTTVPQIWANNDRMHLKFEVPIVGWKG